MNRAGVALVGASFLVLLGVLDLQEAWQALDPETLIFLFGIMVLNAHLAMPVSSDWQLSGFYAWPKPPFPFSSF